MSVTFWIPDAPTRTVEENCCACDGSGKDGDSDDACPYCKGTGFESMEESTLPEVNMANANAAAFLDALGVPANDLCGTWSPVELPTIETKLMLMQMGTGVGLEQEDVRHGIFYMQGRDADYVTRRTADLLSVVRAGIRNNMKVCWG